ncbi:MAG: xylosidase [Cellvibrio sp.]|nr:xylosidase [Cellvibrio sp.]
MMKNTIMKNTMKNRRSLNTRLFNPEYLAALLGAGVFIALCSPVAMAACNYSIDSEWSNGFTASITIKNDTGAPINNWNVNWQYNNNRMVSGWNANFSGTNPYSATNLNWNGSIAVGQSISFGLQGEKNGGSAERPAVNGAACGGVTTPVSSARSSSSTPATTSSLPGSSFPASSTPALVSSSSRSSAATQASLLIQEAQTGFCRVDGSIDTNNAGFIGAGFANTNNVQGAAVVWAIQASASSRSTLAFRFANGGTANRNGSLVINGGSNGNYTLSLPSTGSWTNWQTASIEVDLVQGNNIVQLSSTTAEGLPNIDSLSVAGANVSAGDCTDTSPPTSTCPSTYSNPLIWEDLPDSEVIRVGDAYYYTASTFHHSPGAPVLRSYDLVNWEYISHSVPVLDFDSSYNLAGSRSYVNGIWASTLQYRESNKTFYWMGCMHNKGGGYVFTATSPEGPWSKNSSQACYYDMGLLVDKDTDKMYVAWGNNSISVAELSADGMREVRRQEVFKTPATISGPLEGSRFYKINGNYYIFMTQYANGEYVARSTNGPFGPYEIRPFAVKLPYAGVGSGGAPHQGGIVQTQNGDWYYIAFNDAFPAGRLPVMAPVTWSNGWPSVTLVNGQWGASYPFPNLPCGADKVKPRNVKDTFTTTTLNHAWEWNHNPDNSKWSTGNGLTLRTATVTNDLYAARNTLTRRIEGPRAIATIELDYSAMQNGDVSGLAALRDLSAWIGVKKANGATRVVTTSGAALDSSWNTSNVGAETASAAINGGKIWLRVDADVRTTSGGGTARFYYSTNGTQFTQLGGVFTMKREWNYFLGYRFGIFNYANQSLGGSVRISSFDVTKP